MEAFDLDWKLWPEIVASATILGPSVQMPDVAVVASCSHDTACAVAAAPVRASDENWAYVSCGTWSLLGVELHQPLLSDGAREAGFTNEAGIDGTVRFLKNLTGLWVLQECAREWGKVDWADLEDKARRAGEEALFDLEDPRFLARGNMEARLRAYCTERGMPAPETRGGLVRAVLASIAGSYRGAIEDLQRVTGNRIDTLYLFGGGSRNRLLCELTAKSCGIDVVAGPAEATALGNLLIQARAMGDLPRGATIREIAARSSDLEVYRGGAD
jgi:rhamnulokinase